MRSLSCVAVAVELGHAVQLGVQSSQPSPPNDPRYQVGTCGDFALVINKECAETNPRSKRDQPIFAKDFLDPKTKWNNRTPRNADELRVQYQDTDAGLFVIKAACCTSRTTMSNTLQIFEGVVKKKGWFNFTRDMVFPNIEGYESEKTDSAGNNIGPLFEDFSVEVVKRSGKWHPVSKTLKEGGASAEGFSYLWLESFHDDLAIRNHAFQAPTMKLRDYKTAETIVQPSLEGSSFTARNAGADFFVDGKKSNARDFGEQLKSSDLRLLTKNCNAGFGSNSYVQFNVNGECYRYEINVQENRSGQLFLRVRNVQDRMKIEVTN
jgi:hypothetical protein